MAAAALILLAAVHHSRTTLRIIGIVFIVIGAFTFTLRRALVARNPQAAPAYARTRGPIASGVMVVIGLVLVILG